MPENMKRKITVEPTTTKSTSNDTLRRPSVFERLGTKASTSSTTSSTPAPVIASGPESSASCRHWVLTGTCPYGKSCKNASTHTLISPSKQRAAKKDSDPKQKNPATIVKPLSNSAKDELNKRLHSAVIKKRTGASPDLNWENWDQTDLEYEDEKVLEKRRQLLQRELELQMSQDKEEQQKKKKVKKVKKGVSSSSSTSGSSSSSSESSSSSDESSSSSSSTSADSRRKKMKPKTAKRDSSSSTSGADRKKKTTSKSTKSGSIPPGMKKALPTRKEEQRPQTGKKRESPISKKSSTQPSSQPLSSKNRSTISPSRNRHRSQSPQHSNDNKNKSVSTAKSKTGGHLSPKRSESADKKERRNNSTSPRPSTRDRDRERDRERERERDKIKEKEREKEKERDRDKDSGKSRGRDKSQSPGPNSRGKDGASSPRRRPTPRDPRKRESPDTGVGKEKSRQTSPARSRRSVSRGRSSVNPKHPTSGREADRRESNRSDQRDARDKNIVAKKPEVRRGEGGKVNDTSDLKGNSSRSKEDQDKSRRAADTSSSKNSSKKTLPVTSATKSTLDRDFSSKSDKDRNSNKDTRDVSRDSKESRDRDGRDNADPRLSRNTKTIREREAAREKEREEALERCRERQRERDRKAREEKAREDKVREEKAREEKAREHERELPSLLMIATHNPIKTSRNAGSDGSKDKGSERGSDRDRDSDKTIDRSRRADRSVDRNLNRSADRSDREVRDRDRERGDRHSERDRGFDRAPEHERSIVREPSDRERIPERDRGFERDSDRGLSKDSRSNNRSFDRSTERNFERDAGRFDHGHMDRDSHSDREYPGLPPRGRDDRRPGLGLEDKSVAGYDSPYDARRGRDERPRYGEPMERGRYEDSIMSREDQRRSGGDIRNFNDDRRGHREGRASLEPGWATRNDRRSPNKSRDYEPRSPIKSRDYGSRSPNKSRDYEPRSPNKSRDYEPRSPNKSRDYEPRSPLLKGRDYEPRSPCHSLKGRDWDSRDYGDSRREWDGRGGRRGPPMDWDNQHRDWPDKEVPRPVMDDDWDMYGAQREWPPGGGDRWTEEWDRPPRSSSGPPPRAPMDYVMPSPRDVKPDAPVLDERKDVGPDTSSVPDKLPAKLEEMPVKEVISESLKRPREATDGDLDKPEAKKICLEEPVVPLEEDLSDISDDDADEILNREDIEQASNLAEQDQLSVTQPTGISLVGLASDQVEPELDKDADKIVEKLVIEPSRDSGEQHLLLAADDETVDSLDFEEISDEELEEEARAGLGDALGVDWASLVAEQKPRVRNEPLPGSARRRWDGHRMLARIGVSVRYLGQDMVDEISSKLAEIAKEDGDEAEESGFLHPVASIHVSLREKRERRKELFTSAGPYRRALSARRDLLVRRQLCGLPVKETTVDSQGPNTEEIFRLAVQLFERGV